MNERLMRAAPGCFAEFITAFEAEEKTSKNKGPEPLWLIWQYEGDYTLWDLMQKKDFPYNLEQALLGRELDMPKGPQRKAVTISLVMQQVCLLSSPCVRPLLTVYSDFFHRVHCQMSESRHSHPTCAKTSSLGVHLNPSKQYS